MKVTGISVSFKGTIPTQAYGNIALDVTWQAELSPDDSPEQQTQNLFARIRGEVIAAVEPIAKARVKGMESALQGLPQQQREQIMQQGGIFNFLNMIAPELAFAEKSQTYGGARQELLERYEKEIGRVNTIIAALHRVTTTSESATERNVAANLLEVIERILVEEESNETE